MFQRNIFFKTCSSAKYCKTCFSAKGSVKRSVERQLQKNSGRTNKVEQSCTHTFDHHDNYNHHLHHHHGLVIKNSENGQYKDL